jgi:hypothetical protein
LIEATTFTGRPTNRGCEAEWYREGLAHEDMSLRSPMRLCGRAEKPLIQHYAIRYRPPQGLALCCRPLRSRKKGAQLTCAFVANVAIRFKTIFVTLRMFHPPLILVNGHIALSRFIPIRDSL